MGTDRYYKMEHGMWPKSSKRFADRMERETLKFGLGLGALLFKSLADLPKIPAVPVIDTPKSLPTPTNKKDLAKSSKRACIALIILTPVFQALCYVAYVWWGWWPFFALLLFSTIAVALLGCASLFAEDLQDLDWRVYKRFEIIITVELCLYFISNLWPILLSDGESWTFAYILMCAQMFFAVLITINIWRDYKERKISVKDESSKPVVPAHKRRTSRTARVKDMETRYDRVKVAFAEVIKAEEKLGEYREDIEALREYVDSGKWQKDFEADGQGKLPEDLKRSVLSENELRLLLEEVEERV